jgi:hypothetical protein
LDPAIRGCGQNGSGLALADDGWVIDTTRAKTFHCHFDDKKGIALAMGPLPDLTVSFRIEAENEKDAAKKLAHAIGR